MRSEAILDGHPAQGVWEGQHLHWHINCLEMKAVSLALRYFLTDLKDYHVGTDRQHDCNIIYTVNHQGGLHSSPFFKLMQQILLWAQDKLLSLKADYIPGHLNVVLDILSRQGLRRGEWRLHPEIVHLEEVQLDGSGLVHL